LFQYPINFKNQGPVARESPKNGDNRLDPYGATTTTIGQQYNAPTTDYNNTPHMPETSAESLAKQQILAEIKETQFLMQGSVTPDAAAFWSQHLEELNQRLVALSLEEQLQGGGGDDMYNKTPTKEYEMPTIQQREDYMDNSGRMRNETAGVYEGGGVGMMENDLEQGQMSPGIREYIQEANVAPPHPWHLCQIISNERNSQCAMLWPLVTYLEDTCSRLNLDQESSWPLSLLAALPKVNDLLVP